VSDLVRLGLKGDFEAARGKHFELLDAMRASFFEANPGPVKAVLAEMGLVEESVRLPLDTVTAETRRRVLDAYRPHIQTAVER
jgi:4-hydroxy-tetrahydrodipicolinate synthase